MYKIIMKKEQGQEREKKLQIQVIQDDVIEIMKKHTDSITSTLSSR